MKWFLGLVAVVLVSSLAAAILASAVGVGVCEGRTIPGGRYFGQNPPGFTPVVFAPGIISLPNRYEYCLNFSPNLDECAFSVTNSGWGVFNLFYTKMGSDSTWIDPIPAPFQGNGDGTDPFYSSDGNEIYFVSSRPSYPPTRLWRSSREGAGWSEPLALDEPINSTSNQWGGALTNDGTLYFCSTRPGGLGNADVYRAVTSPGGEVTVENLGAAINTPQLEGSVCAARDGSYIILESQRPGGYGQSDLYISYYENGVWTAPRNLGPGINTSQIEDNPFVSPDGKYFFFNRRRAPYTAEQTEIWWVDARAVFNSGPSGVQDPGVRMGEQLILRNVPNPFGPSTTITYSTPSSGFVAIKVYDVLGREVRSLVNAARPAGTHSVKFDVPRGDRSADGVYYCSLHVGDRILKTTKIVSLR
jgi:Tol biopolymer transport system component